MISSSLLSCLSFYLLGLFIHACYHAFTSFSFTSGLQLQVIPTFTIDGAFMYAKYYIFFLCVSPRISFVQHQDFFIFYFFYFLLLN